jgi:hypothetical protein
MSDQPAGREQVRPEDLLPTRATEYRTGALRLPDSVRMPVPRDEPVTVPLRVGPAGGSQSLAAPGPAGPVSATGLLDSATPDAAPRPALDRDTD